jgi:hypothetical protein
MSRLIAVALSIACAACSHPSSVSDAGVGVDASAFNCPANLPGGRCSWTTRPGPDCNYGDSVCRCGSDGFWYCRSSQCPDPQHLTSSCSKPGLICVYDFESTCVCVEPEGAFECCGGVPLQLQNPIDGAPCCMPSGGASACSGGVQQVCLCEADDHLHCSTVACD